MHGQLVGEEGNENHDDHGLDHGGGHGLHLVALLHPDGAVAEGHGHVDHNGHGCHHQRHQMQLLADEHIGNIAVRAAAEEADKRGILHSQGLALQDHVGQSAEDQHTGQGGDEGRNLHIGDPEGLPAADGQADGQHGKNRDPHIGALAHHHRADGADKADNGADGQVDVAAGEDTQQHTGGQHEHIGVLGEEVIDILGQQDLAVCLPGEEGSHQHQDQHHGILLDKPHDFLLVHLLFLLYVLLPDFRMAPMIFSWVAS